MDETVKTHAKPISETFDVEMVDLPSPMDNRPAHLYCNPFNQRWGWRWIPQYICI